MTRIISMAGSLLRRHPGATVALVIALLASPVAFWYVHAHPVRHVEVCSYRIVRYQEQVPVYVPFYCERPAGR